MMEVHTPILNWTELKIFQIDIAKRWSERGNKTDDTFAKFFFYFTGFNALYFLWKKIDNICQGEGKQIENLLEKFEINNTIIILNKINNSIYYFTNRLPISRMDQRDLRRPNTGNLREGMKWRRLLKESNEPLDQIIAMGHILYLIRCNLVHGSKSEGGDDKEIINASIQPLKIFLEESIKLTKARFRIN